MEMNELIGMITNSGIAIVVVAFFMYRDLKFSKQLNDTLQSLIDTTNLIKDVLLNRSGYNE